MTASPARSSDPPAPATRRLSRHERREAILAAAAAAFARTGFPTTSIADISATAGVSHLIVYRHFDSKDAVLRAVYRRDADAVAEGEAEGGGSEGSADDRTAAEATGDGSVPAARLV